MPAGTLLIAPHPDDAAFSLGGSIAAGILPQPLTLLTVFGRSTHAVTAANGDPERVTALRQAEETAYAQSRGLDLVWLGWSDAALRDPAAPLLVQTSALPSSPDFGAIRDCVATRDPALVLAPLGLGGHVDHLHLQRGAASFADGRPLAYYEDLPYAGRIGKVAKQAWARQLDAQLQRCELAFSATATAAKLADIAAYPSQLTPGLMRLLARMARHRREIVWATPPAAKQLSPPR